MHTKASLVTRIERYIAFHIERKGKPPARIPLHPKDAIRLGALRWRGIPIRVLGRTERRKFWLYQLSPAQPGQETSS